MPPLVPRPPPTDAHVKTVCVCELPSSNEDLTEAGAMETDHLIMFDMFLS